MRVEPAILAGPLFAHLFARSRNLTLTSKIVDKTGDLGHRGALSAVSLSRRSIPGTEGLEQDREELASNHGIVESRNLTPLDLLHDLLRPARP